MTGTNKPKWVALLEPKYPLDRYLRNKRNSWQIGRDYERYIGYLYEKKGYDVIYQGIIEGYEDLGRDLICKKGKTIEIVQCKYWAKDKIIREKHINQLYGTTIKYMIDKGFQIKHDYENSLFPNLNLDIKIIPVFVTSTKFSSEAEKFALALGVKLIENKRLEKYPLIKCHLTRDNKKIYHLPFDQQYDKTKLNKKGSFYVMTVKEAEEKGYRRAYKWHGNN